MHRLRILALCVWLAMLLSIAIAAGLWRHELRPHAVWATLSLLLVLGSAVLLTCYTCQEIKQGKARLPALGWWLLGTTPLLWFAAYAATIYIDATHRQPLRLDAPLRMLGGWSCSFFDLEARLRYPRWTPGQQTILIDSGQTPVPESLVSQMDEHIAAMMKLLEQPSLATPVTWVRGSIFGMEGRSNGPWAICNASGSPDQLDGLDRHEVAHSVMTILAGPDQDPPALLIEGWAESQSTIREDQIRHLARQRRDHRTYSLRELIEPDWYLRSHGPVYSHGGPLVHFLIERFGGPKFFELYRDVRRPTFMVDCERILGVAWNQLDADFWTWLAAEDEKLPAGPAVAQQPKNWSLEFADSVSQQDWKTLVDACLAAKRSRRPLPHDAAIGVHWTWARTDWKRSPDPLINRSETFADFAGDDFWIHTREDSESYLMCAGDRCVSLTRNRSGDLDGWVSGPEARGRLLHEAAELIDMYRGALGRCATSFLPIGDEYASPADYRIVALVPPADGTEGIWKVALLIRYKDGNSNRYELEIDSNRDWQVTKYRGTGTPESRTHESANFENFGGVWFAAASKFEADYTAAQEQVVSEAGVRKLSGAERRALRERVEQMAKLRPTKPWHRLRMVLTVLVIVWPVVGLACGLWPSQTVGQSNRIRVQSTIREATATATSAPMIGPTTGIQA